MLLLGVMALIMPASMIVPVHTVAMLGAGVARTAIMWRHVMQKTIVIE